MSKERKIISIGLFSAVTASMCCITPVLALLAGTSGMAASFSWLEPFRPYFIGITILMLSFAWFNKIRPSKAVSCACDTNAKSKFIETKAFLVLISVFAIMMILFPSYADIFYPNSNKGVVIIRESNIKTAEFEIEGMTCNSCAEHVKFEVNKLEGIISASASYENKNAIVQFDNSKATLEQIESAINSTGYKVIRSNKGQK